MMFEPSTHLRAVARRSGAIRHWRKGLVLCALAVVPGVPSVASAGTGVPPDAAAWAALNPVTPLNAGTFASPPQNDKPWARWNFPPATVDIPGLLTDVQDAYDHGVAGLEIGQGGVPTVDQLVAIYGLANSLGETISLKVASALPNTTYSDTDPYARRTLEASKTAVNAGASFSGAVTGTATGTIVAVEAFQCSASPCPASGTTDLIRSSEIDLTSTLTGTNTSGYQGGSTSGNLNWTAPASPAGAQWVVIAFRAIPFGLTPETLSLKGTKELTDGYDAYFSGPLGPLVKANNGDFFVDSHASDPWGAPEELWSSNMRSEFQARAGYDIVPVLPALFDPTMLGGSGPYFSFSDGSGNRIRSDFNRVRSTLFTQNRLVAFENWAHTYNMKLRVQQEDGLGGAQIGDQIETSLALDQSEYESLTGSDQTDLYRSMASANHMDGNTWYSTECCADLNESYAMTTQDEIIRMNHEFAGGVNRPVYHIRPYIDSPVTSWPGLGFSATAKVSFSNAWNRSEPYWATRRGQQLLRAQPRGADAGRRKGGRRGVPARLLLPGGLRHDRPKQQALAGPRSAACRLHLGLLRRAADAALECGRDQRPPRADGPDYKALIFDQF